jgi:multiple sugar transport system substrate-binding protein
VTRRGLLAASGAGALAGAHAAGGCAPGQGGAGGSATKLAGKVDLIYVADPGEQQVHERWVARFHELNPALTVGLTLLKEDAEYVPKLISLAASGQPPDASYVHPAMLPGLAARGVLAPIESFVQKDRSARIEDFYATTLDYYRHKGRLWGLTYYSGPSVTYFNKTLFERLGVETPDKLDARKAWTWQALIEAGKRLVSGQGETKTFGYMGTSSSLHWFNVAIWGNGGEVWDAAMTKMLLDQPPALAAIELHTAMQTQHRIVPDAEERRALPGGFVSGRVGVMYGIRGNVPGFKDVAFDLGMAGLPAGPQGRFCRNGPNAFCLYAGSKQQDAAWAYANWVTQAEAQRISFDLKRSVPARKSIANSGEFEKALYPWESAAVYREASEKVRGFPLPSTYDDVNKLFGTAYNNVLSGKQGVREAITTVLPQMNQLLSQKL